MKLSKIFNPRVVIIILLLAFLLGIIGSVLISCVERVIYPRNYSEYVTKYAEKYGVPTNLVYAVIKTESGFDSNAVSRVGAIRGGRARERFLKNPLAVTSCFAFLTLATLIFGSYGAGFEESSFIYSQF